MTDGPARSTADVDRHWPAPLRAGDRVHVVAPSGPVTQEALTRGVRRLAEWGLDVMVGPHVLDRSANGMLAGSDAARAADLTTAWTDDEAGAVLCARGGYGASRLPRLLDLDELRSARPKWLVGSSDVTVLHQLWGRELAVVTAFGPMVAADVFAEPDGPSAPGLRSLLSGGQLVTVESDGPAIRSGRAEGRLVGGNLTLLAATVGTPYGEGAGGGVALLEDVGEEPYRVDRMVTQLLESGWFDGVRGVVLGTWQGCGDVLPVLEERLSPLGVPVLAGLPVGHGPVQLSVPLGGWCSLDAGGRTLTVTRGPR